MVAAMQKPRTDVCSRASAVTGVFVDARGHIWVTHLPETLTEEETSIVQNPPIATCCAPAPPVIEIDAQGKVVQGWGQAR